MAATVLVVEDERKLRDLVRSYLERAGFTVLSTDSGAEAITMALTSVPDLVILDLGLPDVPGETVARELRRTGPTAGTPILMLTARTAEEDRPRPGGWPATAEANWSSTSRSGRPWCAARPSR